jgi:hypothetical protein
MKHPSCRSVMVLPLVEKEVNGSEKAGTVGDSDLPF